MAVMDNLSARLIPQGRGRAQVALMGFNASKLIPNYRTSLSLLFVRRGTEERLGDWPTHEADPMGFVTIKPIEPQQKGMEFVFSIDGAIVDALAYDGTDNFLLKLRTVDPAGQEVIRTLNVDVQRKNGRGLEANLTGAAPHAQPGPTPNFAQAQAQLQPQPQGMGPAGPAPIGPNGPAAPAAAAKSGGGIGKIIALIVLLLLLGVGAYFLWQMFAGSKTAAPSEPPAQEEPAPEPEPEPEPEPSPAPAPAPEAEPLVSGNAACRLDGTSGDERDILNMCLAAKPTREDLTGMLAEALRLERCEIAQRILRTLGRAPDGTAFAFVYATYADPNNAATNKCIAKRASDADYWYLRVKNDRNFKEADGIALMEQLTGQSYQAK